MAAIGPLMRVCRAFTDPARSVALSCVAIVTRRQTRRLISWLQTEGGAEHRNLVRHLAVDLSGDPELIAKKEVRGQPESDGEDDGGDQWWRSTPPTCREAAEVIIWLGSTLRSVYIDAPPARFSQLVATQALESHELRHLDLYIWTVDMSIGFGRAGRHDEMGHTFAKSLVRCLEASAPTLASLELYLVLDEAEDAFEATIETSRLPHLPLLAHLTLSNVQMPLAHALVRTATSLRSIDTANAAFSFKLLPVDRLRTLNRLAADTRWLRTGSSYAVDWTTMPNVTALSLRGPGDAVLARGLPKGLVELNWTLYDADVADAGSGLFRALQMLIADRKWLPALRHLTLQRHIPDSCLAPPDESVADDFGRAIKAMSAIGRMRGVKVSAA